MRSMKNENANLDMRTGERKLYVGGNPRIIPDEHTQVVQLEKAVSGHLLLPVDREQPTSARRVHFEDEQ